MNTGLSPNSCGVAVLAVGYQTTISSGRSFCGSGSVEDLKPMGLSLASALVVRQIRNSAQRVFFNFLSSLIRSIYT